MKTIELLENKYEIIREYKESLNKEELIEKFTEYFLDYDYVLGDYSYGKLRLKGFNDKNNKKVNDINSILNIENYIKEYCAYNCGYFIVKKCK